MSQSNEPRGKTASSASDETIQNLHAATGLLRFARNDKEQIKKPRGKIRGAFLHNDRDEEIEAFRSWQAWQRPTLPSLET
jgi:hypothetical protein